MLLETKYYLEHSSVAYSLELTIMTFKTSLVFAINFILHIIFLVEYLNTIEKIFGKLVSQAQVDFVIIETAFEKNTTFLRLEKFIKFKFLWQFFVKGEFYVYQNVE